jgi:glycosyltransferase involved in cell wall biosynthesis
MRIVAVNQFYAPDHAATSQLLTDLCEHLAAAGDHVTVITSRGGTMGGDALPAREHLRGVDVVRAPATRFGKATMAGRLADYLSFWASSVLEAARAEEADVLLVLTTPPMIAAGGALVALAKRTPLVTWVQDVYPEAAVKLGYLSAKSPAALALSTLGRATHHAAARIVALSSGMADRLVAQGAPRERIRVLPNWSDGEIVAPRPRENQHFRKMHGFEGKIVAMYSGNLGIGHDVATFVQAARRLENTLPELVVAFIGDGVRRKEAEALAEGLGNVRFLPYQPHETLGESLSAADVHLVSLREDLDGLLVPSKLYGALAAGRPVIYLGPASCEVARVLENDDLGKALRPGDVDGLVRALEDVARNRAAWDERGARARRIFDERYDRPVSCERFRALLEEASREPPPLGRGKKRAFS